MSAAGSKRVKVVHRKFISLRVARSGSSLKTISGQPAKAGCAASAPALAIVGERPRADHQASAAEHPHVGHVRGGGTGGANARGSSRTGSPSPSHTPFEPSFTTGPV